MTDSGGDINESPDGEPCPQCRRETMIPFCGQGSGEVWLECLRCHYVEGIVRRPAPEGDTLEEAA